jgi:hypothetical protein
MSGVSRSPFVTMAYERRDQGSTAPSPTAANPVLLRWLDLVAVSRWPVAMLVLHAGARELAE